MLERKRRLRRAATLPDSRVTGLRALEGGSVQTTVYRDHGTRRSESSYSLNTAYRDRLDLSSMSHLLTVQTTVRDINQLFRLSFFTEPRARIAIGNTRSRLYTRAHTRLSKALSTTTYTRAPPTPVPPPCGAGLWMDTPARCPSDGDTGSPPPSHSAQCKFCAPASSPLYVVCIVRLRERSRSTNPFL